MWTPKQRKSSYVGSTVRNTSCKRIERKTCDGCPKVLYHGPTMFTKNLCTTVACMNYTAMVRMFLEEAWIHRKLTCESWGRSGQMLMSDRQGSAQFETSFTFTYSNCVQNACMQASGHSISVRNFIHFKIHTGAPYKSTRAFLSSKPQSSVISKCCSNVCTRSHQEGCPPRAFLSSEPRAQ